MGLQNVCMIAVLGIDAFGLCCDLAGFHFLLAQKWTQLNLCDGFVFRAQNAKWKEPILDYDVLTILNTHSSQNSTLLITNTAKYGITNNSTEYAAETFYGEVLFKPSIPYNNCCPITLQSFQEPIWTLWTPRTTHQRKPFTRLPSEPRAYQEYTHALSCREYSHFLQDSQRLTIHSDLDKNIPPSKFLF